MNTPSKPPPRPGFFLLILALATAMVKEQTLRRITLFRTTLFLLFLVFMGAFPIARYLHHHPWQFVTYWLIVFVLVVFLFLLAMYDLLQVRAIHQKQIKVMRSQLEAEIQDEIVRMRALAKKEQEDDRLRETRNLN